MTQILYIDPNSELGPHKEFIQQFFEDNVPDYKYRFAKDEEYENLTCITNDPVAGLRPKWFRKISCEYLQNILNEIFHVKNLRYEEKIEIIKMCLSEDRPSKALGVSLLCKFAFPPVTRTFVHDFIKYFACYILSVNDTTSGLGRMYRISFTRDHFKNECIRFFTQLIDTKGSYVATSSDATLYSHIKTMLLDHFGLTEKQNE